MRKWVLLGLLLPTLAFAQEPANLAGRYQGTVFQQQADGLRDAGRGPFFLTVLREGNGWRCISSITSYEESTTPCSDVVATGNRLRFTLPFSGGVAFNLEARGGSLTGSLASTTGQRIPFNRVEFKRSGDLTLSDLSPKLEWEGSDRSTAILELRRKLAEGDKDAVSQFWAQRKAEGAPILEPASDRATLVTFLWRGGDHRNVFLLWQASAVNPDNYFFSRIPGTDVWFKTLKLRSDTRTFYRISPDDPLGSRPAGSSRTHAQADPLNPKRESSDPNVSPSNTRSILELPSARPQPWYAKNDAAPKFTLVDRTIRSRFLKGDRKVKIYLPPGYSAKAAPYPTLYYTDGEDPDGYVFASWTFENLLAAKRIPPMILVRIVNPDPDKRGLDLRCNPDFSRYLAGELAPMMVKEFRASTSPGRTAIGGYSTGGLAAVCAALHQPGSFGLVLSQSGSLEWEPTNKEFAEPTALSRDFGSARKLPIRFYIDVGTDELDPSGRGANALIPSRQLRDVLRAKGYAVTYQEFSGGHEYINWRGTIADGIIALFGR